jgi:hypothetical protein
MSVRLGLARPDGSTPRWRRRATCCCLAGLGLAVGVAGAAAAAWSPAVRLSPVRGVAFSPQLGLGPRGESVAVWATAVGPPADGHVVVSERASSGSGWSHPLRLSSQKVYASFPGVAVDRQGMAVAVWQNGGAGSKPPIPPSTIEASVQRHPGGLWSRAVRFSPTGTPAAAPAVGIGARGRASAVWYTSKHGVRTIQASTFDPHSGKWSAPTKLFQTRRVLADPRLAVSSQGEAVAVWKRELSGSPLGQHGTRFEIQGATRPAGSRRWTRSVNLGSEIEPPGQGSASSEYPGPQLSIDGNGDAIVVWQMGTAKHVFTGSDVWNAQHKSWRGARAVSHDPALMPAVAVNPKGDTTVVWRGAHGRLQAAQGHIPSGKWTRPVTVSRQIALFPAVAMDRFGDVIASWGAHHVQAAIRRRTSRRWSPPTNVGPYGGGGSEQVAFTSTGSAVLLWQQPTEHPRGIVIETARYSR